MASQRENDDEQEENRRRQVAQQEKDNEQEQNRRRKVAEIMFPLRQLLRKLTPTIPWVTTSSDVGPLMRSGHLPRGPFEQLRDVLVKLLEGTEDTGPEEQRRPLNPDDGAEDEVRIPCPFCNHVQTGSGCHASNIGSRRQGRREVDAESPFISEVDVTIGKGEARVTCQLQTARGYKGSDGNRKPGGEDEDGGDAGVESDGAEGECSSGGRNREDEGGVWIPCVYCWHVQTATACTSSSGGIIPDIRQFAQLDEASSGADDIDEMGGEEATGDVEAAAEATETICGENEGSTECRCGADVSGGGERTAEAQVEGAQTAENASAAAGASAAADETEGERDENGEDMAVEEGRVSRSYAEVTKGNVRRSR